MKTKPHTIRFDEDDFNFICKREGFKTAQSILNFLVSNYMKLYKVENKSIFTPTETNNIEEVYKSHNQSKTEIVELKKSFQQHINDISELIYEDEYKKKYSEIEMATNLSDKEKNLLFMNMKQTKS